MPQEKKAVAIDLAVFDRYVGEYTLEPGVTITVTREGIRFLMQASGEPKLEIFPMSETRFFLKAVDGEIEFDRDAGGRATGLTLYRGERALMAKKVK